MAKIHGRNSSIYLENTSQASTTVSGTANSLTFDDSRDAPEVTSFGDNTRQNLEGGLLDWEISVDGFNDMPDAVGSLLYSILHTGDGSTVVKVGFAGSSSTCQLLEACALLTEVSVEAAVDGAETYSFTLIPRSGSMTFGTW
jgi:hypothetical protein